MQASAVPQMQMQPYTNKSVERLEWTPPSWYEPRVPEIVSHSVVPSVVRVPVITMQTMKRDMGQFVRAYDALPEPGYPMFAPSNAPFPVEVYGEGLKPPRGPARDETPWTKYPAPSTGRGIWGAI